MFEIYTKMFQALLPGKVEEFAKKEKGTVKDAIMVILSAWIVAFVLALIGEALAVGQGAAAYAPILNLLGGEAIGGLVFVAVAFGMIAVLIWSIISNYIVQWFGSFVAKAGFKGTGNFPQQFYVAMLFTGAITIINAVFSMLFGLVPALGILSSIIAIVLSLWSLYLLFITVKAVQKVETLGGAVTIIAMFIAAFVITIIMAIIIGIILIALGVGALGTIAGAQAAAV